MYCLTNRLVFYLKGEEGFSCHYLIMLNSEKETSVIKNPLSLTTAIW